MFSLTWVLAAETATQRLLSLNLAGWVILAAYFMMVLGIGW